MTATGAITYRSPLGRDVSVHIVAANLPELLTQAARYDKDLPDAYEMRGYSGRSVR